MSHFVPTRLRAGLVLVVLITILALTVVVAQANVRLEDAGDVPFYARLAGNEILSDGTWVVIPFYRPPSCIRPEFNLLDFFDVPAAFDCTPYTTDGFAIWRNGPAVDPAPMMTRLNGLGAVPFWFVSSAEMQAAVADGMLTTPELAALPSLMTGTAVDYSEVLHPTDGGNPHSLLEIVARGQLADGRDFFVQVIGSNFLNVHIDFD